MRRRYLAVLSTLICLCVLGCHDEVVEEEERPRIVVQKISSASLPTDPNASRTYYALHGDPPRPEILLKALWTDGLRPRTAWQPLQEGAQLCLAVMPPASFTVELDAPDPRILDHGFGPGTNALKCTTVYMRYRVVD